jgi:hypothetical protein
MQELLPLVTGLAKGGEVQMLPAGEPVNGPTVGASNGNSAATSPSLARRLFAAAGDIAGSGGKQRRRSR